MSDIKVGDTVRLKSGSPLMTVTHIADYGYRTNMTTKANCSWFDESKLSEAVFVLESLKLDNSED